MARRRSRTERAARAAAKKHPKAFLTAAVLLAVFVAVCACLYFFGRNFFGKRPFGGIGNEKAIQVFHARPGRRAIVCGAVVPAEYGDKIHYFAARIQALRNKIGAVASQPAEIVVLRIAPECPFSRVCNGLRPVVIDGFHSVSVCAARRFCHLRPPVRAQSRMRPLLPDALT